MSKVLTIRSVICIEHVFISSLPTDPIAIPDSPLSQTVKLFSNGNIGLEPLLEEDDDEIQGAEVLRRSRRSAVEVMSEGGPALVNADVLTGEYRPLRKNVETLVVVDRAMIENHQRDHTSITTYVLTVMNMVSGVVGVLFSFN